MHTDVSTCTLEIVRGVLSLTRDVSAVVAPISDDVCYARPPLIGQKPTTQPRQCYVITQHIIIRRAYELRKWRKRWLQQLQEWEQELPEQPQLQWGGGGWRWARSQCSRGWDITTVTCTCIKPDDVYFSIMCSIMFVVSLVRIIEKSLASVDRICSEHSMSHMLVYESKLLALVCG